MTCGWYARGEQVAEKGRVMPCSPSIIPALAVLSLISPCLADVSEIVVDTAHSKMEVAVVDDGRKREEEEESSCGFRKSGGDLANSKLVGLGKLKTPSGHVRLHVTSCLTSLLRHDSRLHPFPMQLQQ